MEITEAIERKRQLEINIKEYVIQQLQEFSDETGLSVSDITIDFLSERNIGDRKPTTRLTDITATVEV